jgi:hypothetical protein
VLIASYQRRSQRTRHLLCGCAPAPLTYVATAKFGGFLPLNRLQKTFGRRLSLIPRPNAPSLTLIKWLTEVGAAPADGIGNQRGHEHEPPSRETLP